MKLPSQPPDVTVRVGTKILVVADKPCYAQPFSFQLSDPQSITTVLGKSVPGYPESGKAEELILARSPGKFTLNVIEGPACKPGEGCPALEQVVHLVVTATT